MVRITERIMKFFRKKKTRIRTSEISWKTFRDVAVQKNFGREYIKNNNNQEKIIQFLHNENSYSPRKRIFSHYAPLPAIGAKTSTCDRKTSTCDAQRPILLRQKTYTVLNPVYVTGPEFLSKMEVNEPTRSKKKPIKSKESLQDIKNKYKKMNSFDFNCTNKNSSTAFWFAV